MKEIKKEGWVVAVLALILAVVNRINQNAEINRVFIFNKPEMYWKYYVMTVVALIVSFFMFVFFIWILFEVGRWHHENCIKFIRYFLIYFAIQFVLLLCIWPGNFKQDEVYLTIFGVINMEICWYQSFFSQIFYIVAYLIFPYVASVTFLQILIISLLAAGIMQKAEAILENKKYMWLLLVPFLLFPVLDSNLFPLRNSLICWVYSFIVVSLYTEYRKNGYIGQRCAYVSVFLSVFIGVWKTEFLYLVPCVLFIIIVYKKKEEERKEYLKVLLKSFIIAAVSYFILTIPDRFFQPANSYVLTAIATPLSEIMVNHQYDRDISLKEEFEMWDETYPIDEIKKYRSLGSNTPNIIPTSPGLEKQKKKELLWSGVKICLHYRKEFIDNRFKLYAKTNGFVPDFINHGFAIQPQIDGKDVYNAHFRYTQLADPKLRAATISFLACREPDDYGKTTVLYPILYNSTWGMVLLLVFGIAFLIKKKFFHALLCGTILCQPILVFLAAPAYYFMYYMPFYLASYTLSVVFVMEWLDKRSAKKEPEGE